MRWSFLCCSLLLTLIALTTTHALPVSFSRTLDAARIPPQTPPAPAAVAAVIPAVNSQQEQQQQTGTSLVETSESARSEVAVNGGALVASASVAGAPSSSSPIVIPTTLQQSPQHESTSSSPIIHGAPTPIPQLIPLIGRIRTENEEEDYFALLDEHHDNLEQGMIMHLELSEDMMQGEGEDLRVSEGLKESSSTHFLRFGRLRGSAIVDENTGKVKEYKLPLIDINNSQYVGRIQVGNPKPGTPAQEFDVIFDTGSSNLWLNADSCKSEGCLIHRRFHPRKSKTYKKLSIEMSVQFGTGSIEGFLAQDTFTLGPVKVHDQTFGQIKRSTGSVFVTGKFDGILGLSFPSLSAHSYDPVFDSIMKQKLLVNNMFSFYYSLLPKQNSAIMLGEPLRSMYHGDMKWISVSKPFYWEVNLIDILYEGKSTNACPEDERPCKAVIDTGTSLLTGPSEYTTKMIKKLNIDRACGNMNHLGKITYILSDENGEYHFDIDSHYYILKSQTKRASTNLPKYCRAGFMALDVPKPRGPLFILGDVFMRKYYTVFDRDRQRIGLAEAKEG